MASLTRLRRRLLTWQRYTARYWARCNYAVPHGQIRARYAVEGERERRDPRPGWGACYCNGCVGMGPCDDDIGEYDSRCCNAGDDGHPGPCATTCDSCGGDGRCPDCGGIDDLGCHECGGSGSCSECWGQGEHVEDTYIAPRVVTEMAFAERGLL